MEYSPPTGYLLPGILNYSQYSFGLINLCTFPRQCRASLMAIPVKSTDFGGSLPIFLPFLPSYRQPTDLPQSTDFYRFFRGSTEF